MCGRLITASGIDCSGKSTQIELLSRFLRERGASVKVLWYRPGYSSFLDAARRFVRRVSPRVFPEDDAPEARREAFSRPTVRRLWVAMALVDMLVQYGLKLRALSWRHDVVLCDRYLEDAALDLDLRFPAENISDGVSFRLIRRVSPKPDTAFLFLVTHEAMLGRMAAKREPFPDEPEVRERRFEAYQALTEDGRFVLIDAEQSAEETLRALVEHLKLQGGTWCG